MDKTIAWPVDGYGNSGSLCSLTPKLPSFFLTFVCDSVFDFFYVYIKSDVETREYFCIILGSCNICLIPIKHRIARNFRARAELAESIWLRNVALPSEVILIKTIVFSVQLEGHNIVQKSEQVPGRWPRIAGNTFKPAVDSLTRLRRTHFTCVFPK